MGKLGSGGIAGIAPENGLPRRGDDKLSRKDDCNLKHTIQVRIFRGERQYVAECLDLPVVTEARTLDDLAGNIQEAISLHLEGEDLEELGFTTNPTILAMLELDAVA